MVCTLLERSCYTLFLQIFWSPNSQFCFSQVPDHAARLSATVRMSAVPRRLPLTRDAATGRTGHLARAAAAFLRRCPAGSCPPAGGTSTSCRHLSTRRVFLAQRPTKPQVQTEGREATQQDLVLKRSEPPSMQIACAPGTWLGLDPHMPSPQNDRKLLWPGRSNDCAHSEHSGQGVTWFPMVAYSASAKSQVTPGSSFSEGK